MSEVMTRRKNRASGPKRVPPGEFAWLPKGEIHVDPAYQRHVVNWSKVKEARKNWSWVACGTITVALRDDDAKYYAIDGQHRVLIAQELDFIESLPCMIYDIESVEEEAQEFLRINSQRSAVAIAAQFNALLCARNPKALVVADLAESAGRRVQPVTGPNTVACIARLLRCVETDEPALRRVWPVYAELCVGQGMQQSILEGMFFLERKLPHGMSLSDPKRAKRLLSIGYEALKAEIDRTAAFRRTGGSRSSAEGVFNAYNHGLRSGRLPEVLVREDEP